MGTRGARVVAVAAMLIMATACSTPERNEGSARPGGTDGPVGSNPDPVDGARRDATLAGRVVAHDGTPFAGLPVTVVEDRSGALVDAALSAVFTLGIACVATPRSCDVDPRVADSTTTGPDGRFEVRLPGAYLPGFETDEDWVVQVGRAPGDGELTGPSSSFELEVNTARPEAPDLALWDVTPTITDHDASLEVRVGPIGGGPDLRRRTTMFVDDAGATVWRVRGDTVDRRLLEDRFTRLVATGSADVTVPHEDGRTIYHQLVATPSVAYVGDVVPLSRGAACSVADGGLVGCPFTDGDLTTTTPAAGGVLVDLGASVDVGLVVVRGSGSSVGEQDLLVEASTGGGDWQPLRHRPLDGADGWSAGPSSGDGNAPYRYVRVGAGAPVEALAEISVFAPSAAERAGGGGGEDAGGGSSTGSAAALAGVLAVVVGAATLRLRNRERR